MRGSKIPELLMGKRTGTSIKLRLVIGKQYNCGGGGVAGKIKQYY